MQHLEIVVSAKTWVEAVQLLASVGIDKKTKINHRPINGLFIVEATKQVPLTEAEYEAIKTSPDTAIISDSLSRKRIAEVLDKIYDVETHLRKLLLHAYDLIDTFFEVFGSESKYTKDFTDKKSVARKDSLNPITSHLTLGEMKSILGVDLSWNARKAVSAQELNDLLQSVTDLEGLKNEFSIKVAVHTVWDVIAENVLKTSVSWNDVNNDLKILKEFRDASAHYQVITEKQKTKLIQTVDALLKKIIPTQKTTKKDYQNIFYFSQKLSKSLSEQVGLYKTIQKQLMPELTKNITFITSENMRALKELNNIDLGWIKEYHNSLSNIATKANAFRVYPRSSSATKREVDDNNPRKE